jgi:ubiquinone/menaquinone biosynthesis C-methylase UbiE
MSVETTASHDAPSERNTYTNVGAHFDKVAPRYDAGCNKVKWNGPEVLFKRLNLFLDPAKKPLLVLDLGTGTGHLGTLFKQANPQTRVIGVDLSAGMLDIAKREGRVDETRHGSVTDLSWCADQSVDVVTCSGVLDFLNEEEADVFASEVLRVLKPGHPFAVTYEPRGTDGDGVDTLQHDPATLRAQFTSRGAGILAQEAAPSLYTNFKTHQPVNNDVLIGQSLDW